MSQATPGRANATPLVGPVVISEIMYHPSSHDDAEYVELTNISDQPVPLFDPIEYLPWRFQDNEDGSGISLYFPMNPALELQPGERVVIGFAAESEDVIPAAQRKLVRKGCDLMVANDVSRRDAGFDVDTNAVSFVWPGGR